jgi:transposase
MPKPLSGDLRKRIIEAKLRGDTEDKIAAEKEVNKSTIPNGRKPALSSEQLEQIAKTIDEQPDVTLRKLSERLCLSVCISALCRTVNNKLGYRFKKNSARSRTKQGERKNTA